MIRYYLIAINRKTSQFKGFFFNNEFSTTLNIGLATPIPLHKAEEIWRFHNEVDLENNWQLWEINPLFTNLIKI